MTTKFCPNPQCTAHAHVLYTQATRCLFCRWDLKPNLKKSESAVIHKTYPHLNARTA